MNNKRPSANTECPYCGAPGHTWDSYCCTEHYTQPAPVEAFRRGFILGMITNLIFCSIIWAGTYLIINSKLYPGAGTEVSILDQVAHE